MHSRSAIAIPMVLIVAGASAASDILRDPTQPYSTPVVIEATAPRFKVNAIIVSSERRLAIVNGKRVGVGEQVDGATVTSIAKKKLTLDLGGRELTLELNKG